MKQEETRVRYKVFLCDTNISCYECGKQFISPASTWLASTQKEYYALQEAIHRANSNRHRKKEQSIYCIVEECKEEDLSDIFTSAQEFIMWEKEQDEKRKKREVADKKRREKAALTRKKNQLKKLQKELEGQHD